MRLRSYLASLAFGVVAPFSAPAQSLTPWEQFDFARKRVDSAAINQLPLPAHCKIS